MLPNYITEHGKETEWDVVFDARGSFTEPHTGREVRLGTIEVRTYLGQRPAIGSAATIGGRQRAPIVRALIRYPTIGPEHRYGSVLFIEKEGFAPLLKTAQIAERFDIAIMSTKGMSTTAARQLLDRLAPRITKVLVLHDMDVSGFSIFGTLSSDGRRYSFQNELPIVDIGLRLTDVEAMNLQSEPVETLGLWSNRSRTLAQHGATQREVEFLRYRRVELNAMSADVFVGFLERKLMEHGIHKVVPDRDTLERHAHRVIEERLASELMRRSRPRLVAKAASTVLPGDLDIQLRSILEDRPELSWDQAVAEVVERGLL